MEVVNVDNFKLLDLEGKGTAEAYWLSDGSSRYVFKIEGLDSIYNEVLAYILAKQLGIRSAPCVVAERDGVLGVLSQDVNVYGVEMCNLIEGYPAFEIYGGNGYTLDSFLTYTDDVIKTGYHMEIKSIVNMFLFDYLIDNRDRHRGNIGIDMLTGDLAPLYDNAASFTMLGGDTPSLVYCNQLKRNLLQKEVLPHLWGKCLLQFNNYGLDFCIRAEEHLDFYVALFEMLPVMERWRHDRYIEEYGDSFMERYEEIQSLARTGET
jgi:hypothetical protein